MARPSVAPAVTVLFGVETEYAFSWGRPEALGRSGVTRLLELVAGAHAHLPGRDSGIYLGNGARFYIDGGSHPEWATAECTHPADLVAQIRAAERILAGAVRGLPALPRSSAPPLLTRCNVDYSNTVATWGSHESYLHTGGCRDLAHRIIPHLVSRVVFTGAGGLNPRTTAIEFSLSPRAHHLSRAVSGNSTAVRGIVHTKEQPLAMGYRRLHLICGESLGSQLAEYLRVGTTALVLALADRGLDVGRVRLERPAQAMHAIAADPSCTVIVPSSEGPVTAIAIQREYLDTVRAHLGDPFLPVWAAEVCRWWEWTLDRLAADPASLVGVLDWPTKLALFRRHAERRDLTWSQITGWHQALAIFERRWMERCPEPEGLEVGFLRRLLRYGRVVRIERERAQRVLAQHGGEWEDLDRVLALRAELAEIDLRYGQVGGPSGEDDDAVTIPTTQAVVGEDAIRRAVTTPPHNTRASIRGHWIGKLHRDPAACDWTGISHYLRHRFLDLPDPFVASPSAVAWRPIKPMRAGQRA